MLLVFNNPSQSGLGIVQSKVSQEGIYMYYFNFFPCRHIKTKKQTENLLLLDKIILKACKKWPRQEMGRTKFFKGFIIDFS